MPPWVYQSLRLLLFFLGAASGLLAIVLALTAIPESGRNPASTDFGWLRSDWLEGIILATALLGLTIRAASGKIRMLFAALLPAAWAASVVPAYQFWTYQLLPDLSGVITKGSR